MVFLRQTSGHYQHGLTKSGLPLHGRSYIPSYCPCLLSIILSQLVPQENRIQNQSGDPNSGCFPIESSCVTPKQSKRLHSCFFSRTGNGRNIQYSFNVGNAVGNTDFTVASVSTCYGYFASCMPTPFTPIKTMPILAAAASTGAAVLVLTVVVLAFLYTRKK